MPKIMLTVLAVLACVNFTTVPAAPPCVPLAAVDYDGFSNVWRDAQGRPVLEASEEDLYEWCDHPNRGR